MKPCRKCKCEKQEDQFRPAYKRADGSFLLKTICKACETEAFKTEKKKAKDRERTKRIYGTPEYMEVQRRSIDKRKAERLATWHERNTGKMCAIHWHTCEQCNTRTYRIKQSAMDETGPMCGKCKIIEKNILRSGFEMPTKECICPDCNTSFIGKLNGQRCESCASAKAAAHRRKNKKKCDKTIQHRARKHGVHYEPVNRLKVYERDGWACYLCGVSLVLSSTYTPNQASIDHVIPMAKGGPHTYDNVRACCHRCNGLKSDSIIAGHGAPQQRVGP